MSLLLRVPFRSHYAYHWDSAQFALAIGHYDIRQGLPHQPGFFLYVMLGRCVNWVVGDRITLEVANGELEVAEVTGLRYGVYLEANAPVAEPVEVAPGAPDAGAPAIPGGV